MISLIDIDPIDPTALPRGAYQLPTKEGPVAGNFAVVVPDLLVVAVEPVLRRGSKLPRFTCFVREGQYYVAYRDIYRAIRANLYVRHWILAKLGVLTPLARLTQAHLASLFGLATLREGEMTHLVSTLKHALDTDGASFTTDSRTRHSIRVFNRTWKKTRAGSQLLGYGNSNGKITKRLREMQGLEQVVTSSGTVLAQYLDKVLAVVRGERAKVNDVMGYNTTALMSETAVDVLQAVAGTLRQACIVRPTTRVGWRAAQDCDRAVVMIRSALAAGPAAHQGATEPIRNLVSNVRDSLDLLLWQQELQELVLLVAEPAKRHASLSADEWVAARDRTQSLWRAIEPLGSRFENLQSMTIIRGKVREAIEITESGVGSHGAASLISFKSALSAASDEIGTVQKTLANAA